MNKKYFTFGLLFLGIGFVFICANIVNASTTPPSQGGCGIQLGNGIIQANGNVNPCTFISEPGISTQYLDGTGNYSTPGVSVSGLLKGNGGAIVAAIPGTDYLAPNGSGNALTGIPTIIASVSNISATTVANTLAYTNTTGKNIVITSAVIRVMSATSITNGPTIGIGSASGTNDIYAATALNALTATPKDYVFGSPGISVYIPNNGTIYINISTPATGGSESLSVDVIGYGI